MTSLLEYLDARILETTDTIYDGAEVVDILEQVKQKVLEMKKELLKQSNPCEECGINHLHVAEWEEIIGASKS